MNSKKQRSSQSTKKKQLVCLSNQTTNGVRYYLRELSTNPSGFKPNEVLSIIDEYLKSNDKKSKWLVHNVFFLHLNLLELETVKQHYFSLANLDYDPISVKYYVKAIFKLRLHKYFLQMMSIIGHLDFAQRIFSLIINPIVEKKRRLRIREWLCYLITAARLYQKQQQQLNGFSYKEACDKLLATFIGLPSDQMTNLAKAQVLMRFAGTICLKESDYDQHQVINTTTTATSNQQQQIEIEIPDLLKELKYDRTVKNSKSFNTMSVYQNILSIINDMKNKKEEKKSKKNKKKNKILLDEAFPLLTNSSSLLVSSTNETSTSKENNSLDDILQVIGNTLNELKLTDAERANLDNEHLLHGAQRRLVHFIGNCSYLTSLILKKNCCISSGSGTVIDDGIGKILSFTSVMEKYKPKSRCEDYDTRNMTFSEFCLHLCSSKVKYQISWFEKFLTYDESLSSPEGIKLATEVLAPKVNGTLGLEMVKRIMKMYHSSISTGIPLDENVKELLLTLIFSNENMYRELGKIINMIFKKELHSKFCTVGFSAQLNDCNAKLGADSSFDTQSQQLSISCVKTCQRLALQNPKETCQTLLLRTMQLPKGGAELLNALRPFFNLPFTQKQPIGNNNVDGSQLSISNNSNNNDIKVELDNLFEYCLHEICMLVTEETMRNMQTKLAKFVPHIIRLQFITMEKFSSILKSMIISFNEKESCDKLCLLVEIYESLVDCALNLVEKQNAPLKENTDGLKNTNNINKNEKTIEFLNDAFHHLNGLSVAAIFSVRKEIQDLRDKCIDICCKIKVVVHSNLRNNQGFPSEEVTLVEYDWVKRLLLYIRKRDDEEFRETFRQILKTGQLFIPLQEEESSSSSTTTTLSIKNCPNTMDLVLLIRNTSSFEWNDLIEVLFEVFYHFHENNQEQAFKDLCSIFLKVPLFDLLYEDKVNGLDEMAVATTTTAANKTIPSSSMNRLPCVVYQKFCHHVVKAIVDGQLVFSRMNNHGSLDFAYQFVYSFISCLANYPDNDEYLPVKRLTFLSLMDLCSWIMSKNPNEKLKEDIIEWLKEISEEETGKHGSYYGSLLTVCKSDPQSQTLITFHKLSSEDYRNEEEDLDANS